ncbi:MAG: PPK2 family polyphosphate kinase [Gaiellales bacterium]
MFEAIRVKPGEKPRLAKRDAADTLGLDKDEIAGKLPKLRDRIDELQYLLFAEGRRSIVVVLQGMDASGKDGIIRGVFDGVNPQSIEVTSFRAPAGAEREHDYLWRIHAALPPHGKLGIFNRSHYEDIVAVRMLELAPKAVWSRRAGHIREFEHMLADEGVTMIKCFLHVSKEEQATRLQERIDDPHKRWKFRADDLKVHDRYADYMKAYEEAIAETSSDWAPWHIVPADRNWVKAYVVAKLVVDTLETLDPKLPDPEPGIEGLRVG